MASHTTPQSANSLGFHATTHPTKEALIETVVVLLEGTPLDQITSEQVLAISGISRGSLYHHFEDFSELLELAQVRRFSEYVDNAVEVLSTVLESCVTREDLIVRLIEVTKYFQAQDLAQARLERLTAISKVPNNPRMAISLGFEQNRLSEALADLYQDVITKGWGNRNIQPRTASVIIQALTVGRAVDDFTPDKVDQENWIKTISMIIEDVLFPGI